MQGFSRPCCRTNVMHAWKNKQHYSNEAELITDILVLTFLLKSVWFPEGFINFKIWSLPPFPSHQPHTRLNKEWSQTSAFCWDICRGAGCRFNIFKDIYLLMCGLTCHILALHGAITRIFIKLQRRGKTRRLCWRKKKREKEEGVQGSLWGPISAQAFFQVSRLKKGRKTIES